MSEPRLLAFLTGGIGWQEILLIMAVLLIFFGRRIPEVMRSLGRGVSQFKKGLSEVENEVRNVTEAAERKEEPKREPQKELPAPRADAGDLTKGSGRDQAEPETKADEDAGELAG